MTPNRPYLLRAFFDWLLDNELTPHLVVDATQANVTVPAQFITDGQIVLNIAPSAVVGFDMDLHHVSFNARFGGKPFQIYVPMAAVVAIYARENGAGMVFEADAAYQAEQAESDASIDQKTEDIPKKPNLTVVK